MFKPLNAYGNQLNSYDALKLVALLAMVIDHLGVYFWHDAEWLRAIGRMAFPLFLFLVGYSGNWKNKSGLVLQGILIVVCAGLTHHHLLPLNILFTIAITRYAMPFIVRREITGRYLCSIFVACIAWWPLVILCFEYSTIAPLFAICGFMQRQKKEGTVLFLYATLLLYFVTEYYAFRFHYAGSTLLMFFITLATGYLMQTFYLREVRFFPSLVPATINNALRWAARNTLPLYTFHVIVFMLMEKMIFPGKLSHFHWF